MVLNAVVKHPDDSKLFDEDDKNIIQQFFKLSVDPQKLYVRMFQRKIKWHQVTKLDYPEIEDDLSVIVDELIGNEFFDNGFEKMYEIELDLMSSIDKGNWDRGLEIYSSCKELESSQSTENDDLHAHVSTLPRFLRRYSAGSTLVRCLSHGVDILERLRKYEAAVDQLEKLINQTDYHLDYRGRWTERLALNLEQHLKQPKKIVIEGRIVPTSSTSGCKTTFMTPVEDSCDVIMSSVEDFAIYHYKTAGFDEGVHGESSTFTSLFCLLFWDIIFMSGIPDVFRSPHQIAPLDLNSKYFYYQRKEDIDDKLEWIRTASSVEINDQLATSWTMHCGMTSLVNWGLFRSFQHLESLSECITGGILSKICERLAKDYRFTRSGFPDLVVWSTSQKIFKVVEVKGPNDRLSTKQTLWLDFLLNIGVSAEVCHVTGSGTKKLKKGNNNKSF
uniref:Fanconi-associated nuclease n=1 Tax=Strigamia maritima TaxID=126957 RepID=T1IXG8_STRMM